MNTTPTRFTEIGMIVLAALLIIGGVFLIFTGKITFVEFSPFLVAVLGLFGINVAYKAPSPAQAQQLNTLQEQASTHADQIQAQGRQIDSVQNVVAHVANVVIPLQDQAHTHSPNQEQPVTLAPDPVTPSPQFRQPSPPSPVMVDYGRRWGDSAPMSALDTQKIATPQ